MYFYISGDSFLKGFSVYTWMIVVTQVFKFNPCPAGSSRIYLTFANSVDPDQLASEEAN